jgi:glyoxylase-like metal-dependent hydrolase (beta-lactamase superfamily II)
MHGRLPRIQLLSLRLRGTILRYTPFSMTPTIALDLNWAGHSRSIASGLLRAGDTAVLIDPGPSSTLSSLREQLAVQGITVKDLHAILLTHIHLDHAGATGSLVQENPQLRVYVHTRGLPHMVDPSKLLNSAGRLYGGDMQTLFGDFLPVPAANLLALNGGETIAVGSRNLQVLYTPGHASHHVTYFDPSEQLAFVGDTAGICIQGHPFVLPATPPPDIDIELWDNSLDAIGNLHPQRLFLTHFGYSDDPARHIANYRERLHHWSDFTARILGEKMDEEAAMHAFGQEVAADAAQSLPPDEIAHYNFTGSFHLSWLGLARYHRKRATVST